MPAMTVAVLDAADMTGIAMTRKLLRAGHRVNAWNKTLEEAERLALDGAALADTPAEAVVGADAVITASTRAEGVGVAVNGPDGGLVAMPARAVWLQMSTIGIEGTGFWAGFAAGRGVPFVDAPVLEAGPIAGAAEMIVLASGPSDPAVRDRAQPVFDAVGDRTLWLGAAGAGTRMKLVIDAWIASVVEGGAEALALAERLGLDPQDFFAALDGGPLDLRYLRSRARASLPRKFPAASNAKDAVLETIAGLLSGATPEHGEEDLGPVFTRRAPREAPRGYPW